MSKMFDRIPMSRVNLALSAALALGIVITVSLGLWAQTVMLGLILILGLFGVYAGRRNEASDIQRVNALEFQDERDRAIGREGLAAVGAVALVMSLVGYMATLALYPEIRWLALGQFLVLCVAWGIGNHVAAYRR